VRCVEVSFVEPYLLLRYDPSAVFELMLQSPLEADSSSAALKFPAFYITVFTTAPYMPLS